ncbi:hypothetical protein [Sulfurimonas sp.]|uniref:hypothetical protein n=1 Tax=Sulfurimonas sp. TaxID=2022749 RepID=UPI0025DCE021|nr:hypothetical protein [Sulfurimonas sp.]MCK9454008.1 hypothetical protein [Sulfurimonas sp.]
MMVKTIFLQENEKNIFQALENQGINTKVFENHFENLFNKLYNNEVGYYIFNQNDFIYRLIVLPKTINKNSITKEKDFVNYLLHYYRVNNKYQFDNTKRIADSLLSLAFDNINDESNASHLPLDEFEFYKYEAILNRIEHFFKNHKNYKRVKVDYKSQDIKHKLHLANNIKEIDKTKIHQIHTIDMLYSQIATISYHALKFFKSHRINNIDPIYQKNLVYNAKKVLSFIANKFTVDKSYKITLSKLNNLKMLKVFNAKTETQQLLVDIKSLFGFEQMYQDNEVYVSNRYDLTTTSFFINPSTFYEWYVYEILKDFAENKKYKIFFDKDKENKTTTKYNLVSKEHGEDKKRSSNPDYILIDEDKKLKIIFDAKWKNINALADIQSSDFLKLKHDASLLDDNDYRTIPYLIYPKYLGSEDSISISKNESIHFDFGILQIDMNFDKEKNSIDFKYDFEKIEKQIEKEKYEKNIQGSSDKLTSEIDIRRSELITQLLNREGLENKEEIFGKLDNTLLESATKLSEEIGEKISPEVQEVLDQYSDILEEDSIKFLKSSSSIYNYYVARNFEHFDYSMPASGLWKLVELELNTSFSWFLRIKSNVCNNTSPWTNISNSRRSITQDLENRKQVKLNQFEHNNISKLQGIMLGGIILLLKDAKTIEEFDEIENLNRVFFTSELTGFLSEIINLRNEHAHIKAMSLEKFDELYKKLFINNDLTKTNIYKLLEFKKSTKSFITK